MKAICLRENGMAKVCLRITRLERVMKVVGAMIRNRVRAYSVTPLLVSYTKAPSTRILKPFFQIRFSSFSLKRLRRRKKPKQRQQRKRAKQLLPRRKAGYRILSVLKTCFRLQLRLSIRERILRILMDGMKLNLRNFGSSSRRIIRRRKREKLNHSSKTSSQRR